jgi:hypothetical protein
VPQRLCIVVQKQNRKRLQNVESHLNIKLGTFRISQQALEKHGSIMCGYRPILRSKDDFSAMEGNRTFPVVDKTPLMSDFFHVDCQSKDGSSYSNFHMGIKYDPLLHARWDTSISDSLYTQSSIVEVFKIQWWKLTSDIIFWCLASILYLVWLSCDYYRKLIHF